MIQGANINPHENPEFGTFDFTVATYEDTSFFELPWQATYQHNLSSPSAAMSPLKEIDGALAACRGPVEVEEVGVVVKKEDYVEQEWEHAAPRSGTQPSGLFNNQEMDPISGLNTVEGVVDGYTLFMDPSATSTSELSELFPDLTDIFIPAVYDQDVSVSGTMADEGEEAIESDVFASSPVAAKVTTAGDDEVVKRGRQLPSTSSFASSGSETSDYEDGLSPAEVDGALEHFFNEFTDLKEFLVPAEETCPTATVDAATVRSLIDDPTTTDNVSSLITLLGAPNGSLSLSTASTTKRVKDEEDEEEEEACPVAKKSRSRTSTKDPEDAYRQRRIKNNLACKRARQNRRKRDGNLMTTAKALEDENALLRVKIEELTEIAALSRQALVSVLAK